MTPGAPRPSLRIALVDSWTRDPATGSGTAVGVAGLVAGLESLGHRVRRVGPAVSGRSALERLRYNAALAGGLDPLRSPAEEGSAGDALLPDVVVGVDFDGCVAALPDGVPYVVALKGLRADEARFERGLPRLRLSLLSHLEALNAGRADAVVVPSRYSARRAVRLYRIPPGRLRVVPEPLELGGWPAAPAAPGSADAGTGGEGAAPDGFTVLSVARQYPRKNTVTLVAAFEAVARRRDGARLRIVGGGPELPRIRREVECRGLGGRVDVAGAVPDHADVRRAYREADVFALPSRQEGFGIVFLEAMAAGLAIVGSTAGAVPEVVAHGETGLLVDPDDEDGLVRALLRLLDDPGLRHRLGEAGRRRVRRYDAPAVARTFVERAIPGAPGRGGGRA